jgi:hypothetical protein
LFRHLFLPALDGQGNVVFFASGYTGQEGIYLYSSSSGELKRVADRTTAIPRRTEAFLTFDARGGLSEGRIAFLGIDQSGLAGIYSDVSGTLDVVADKTGPLPGSSGNPPVFDRPSLDHGQIAFWQDSVGLYKWSAGLFQLLVARFDPIPDSTDAFLSVSAPVISQGNVAFFAEGINRAQSVWLHDGDLRLIADTETPVPNGIGTFVGFLGLFPALDGRNVAFVGEASPRVPDIRETGVYVSTGGSLELIADRRTAVPGSDETFFGFGGAVLDGTDVTPRPSP